MECGKIIAFKPEEEKGERVVSAHARQNRSCMRAAATAAAATTT